MKILLGAALGFATNGLVLMLFNPTLGFALVMAGVTCMVFYQAGRGGEGGTGT